MKWILPVLLAPLLLEALLRLVPYEPRIASHVVFDPLLGHKGPANAVVNTPSSTLTYTEEGFRKIPLPAGQVGKKIAILGDSFTEAITMKDEELFASRLARELHAEVRIYASGDWGTVQELLAFQKYAKPWKPDLVVLEFTAINDFLNNSVELANRYQSRLDGVRPYWKNGAAGYLHPMLQPILAHTELGRWLANLYLSWTVPRIPPKDADCHLDPHMHGVEMYRVNESGEWKAMLRETTEVLEALRAAADTKVIGVFFPNPLELVPKLYGEVVEGQLHACYPQDPRPSAREGERKFFTVFRASGIPAISFFSDFEKLIQTGVDPFIYDGHLSARGHELAAKLLAEQLKP